VTQLGVVALKMGYHRRATLVALSVLIFMARLVSNRNKISEIKKLHNNYSDKILFERFTQQCHHFNDSIVQDRFKCHLSGRLFMDRLADIEV
jgi:hypothetical protein